MSDTVEPITDMEAAEMRKLLAPLFGPQVHAWQITPRHYELLGKMIEQSQTCTEAMHWVPRPYDFGNPLNWVRRQVRDAVRRALLSDRSQTYVACTKTAARNWASEFHLAGQGL